MKNRKLILVLAMVMVFAFVVVACSETETYVKDTDSVSEARINAIETSYKVVEGGEEYGGVYYVFPKIEGMTNMSKQADANGNMKRFNTKTAKANDGVRGAIADSYEVLISNDKLLSVIFPTTLDIDIATRAMVFLVEDHKFIYTIENLFGKVENSSVFGEMRAVFEAVGASSAQTDDEFRKNLIYFKGDDMKELELHITYFLDGGQDIMVPFEDVSDYLLEEKEELFDFAMN